MAAVLFAGPDAYASHRSAAALWRLDGIEGRPIEITRLHGRRIGGVIVHRRLPTDAPVTKTIDAIPVTGIDRTIIDLASVLSEERLGQAIDSALRRRLTSLGALTVGLTAAKGRTGASALRLAIANRDAHDQMAESRLEAAFLGLLRSRRVPLPRPQHRVELDGTVARLDFAYPEFRLGIELDGFRWHGSPERWARDMRRENRLKLLGWTLLRFSWQDVHGQPDVVAKQVRAALAPHLLQLSSLYVDNCTGS